METSINELSEYRKYVIGYYMCDSAEFLLKYALNLENRYQKFKVNRKNLRKIVKYYTEIVGKNNSYWLEFIDTELGIKAVQLTVFNYKTNESRLLDQFKYKFEEWGREQ